MNESPQAGPDPRVEPYTTLGARAWRDGDYRYVIGLKPEDPTRFLVVDTDHPDGVTVMIEGEVPTLDVPIHWASEFIEEEFARFHGEFGPYLNGSFTEWLEVVQPLAEDVRIRRVQERENELATAGWTSLSEVQSKVTEFMWEPYIAKGSPTLLAGDPGVGKSKAALALAAERSAKGAHVIVLNAEDPPETSLRPFLEKHGADLSKIHIIEWEKMRPLDDEGVALLEQGLARWPVSFVVIDPMTFFLGDKKDMHRANEVRSVMQKLSTLAAKYDLALLALIHVNKGSGQKTLYRILGSIDFSASVRSALVAGKDDEEPSRGRAFFHVKCNNAAQGPPVGFDILADPGDPFKQPRFGWRQTTDLTEGDITGKQPQGRPASKRKLAHSIIVRMLSSAPVQQLESHVVKAALEAADISESTYRRLLPELVEVIQDHAGQHGSSSVWKLKPVASSTRSDELKQALLTGSKP